MTTYFDAADRDDHPHRARSSGGAGGDEVRTVGDAKPTREALLDGIRGSSVVVTMYSDKADREFLDAAGPTLKGVCNFAVGFENIDLDECRRRGIR
jgi:lactate dehydrogenase-like 2-hydroxyacid dehydrogenase